MVLRQNGRILFYEVEKLVKFQKYRANKLELTNFVMRKRLS